MSGSFYDRRVLNMSLRSSTTMLRQENSSRVKKYLDSVASKNQSKLSEVKYRAISQQVKSITKTLYENPKESLTLTALDQAEMLFKGLIGRSLAKKNM